MGGVLAWGLPAPLRLTLGGGWKALCVPLAPAYGSHHGDDLAGPRDVGVARARIATRTGEPRMARCPAFVLHSIVFNLLGGDDRHPRNSYLLSAACLFVSSLVEGALGALMALSVSPWVLRLRRDGAMGIGLDRTSDQQLAGLIMWIPGGTCARRRGAWPALSLAQIERGKPWPSFALRPQPLRRSRDPRRHGWRGLRFRQRSGRDVVACGRGNWGRPASRRGDVHSVRVRQLPRPQPRSQGKRNGRASARRDRSSSDHRGKLDNTTAHLQT